MALHCTNKIMEIQLEDDRSKFTNVYIDLKHLLTHMLRKCLRIRLYRGVGITLATIESISLILNLRYNLFTNGARF